jgi:chromosome segregation ATPase
MALRRIARSILHASLVGSSLFLAAREIASHDFSTSTDVYSAPVESDVSHTLNIPIDPSIESFEEPASIPFALETPPHTTPEYIIITRTPENGDHGPSPVPSDQGDLDGQNPYDNNPLVQGLARRIAPIFGSSYFQAVVRFFEFLWDHPFTQAFVRAINSLIGFGVYLWLLLPGGLRDLVSLLYTAYCFVPLYMGIFGWLFRWLSRKLFRRGDKPNPSDDSASPPPSPPSGGRPGGDGNNPSGGPGPAGAPAGPGPPTNTTSAGTQTGAAIQTNRSTQTHRPTQTDRSTQTAPITAANNETIARQAQIITDLRLNLTDLRQNNNHLQQLNTQNAQQITTLTNQQREQSTRIRDLREQVYRVGTQNNENTSKIDRLETERDVAVTDLESATQAHQEEIERLKKTHEAQIKELSSTRGTTVKELQSEISRLTHANEDLQNENKALGEELKSVPSKAESPSHTEERHNRELEDAVARERAQALKDAEHLQRQIEQQQARIAVLESGQERGLSTEAQREQTKALEDCNDRVRVLDREVTQQAQTLLRQEHEAREAKKEARESVETLEKTNAELKQQNEALLRQEQEAREAEKEARTSAETLEETNTELKHQNEALLKEQEAEEKARSRVEALQREVDSLKASISSTEASNRVAAEEARKAEKASDDINYALRQQLTEVQDSEEGLKSHIRRLKTELENEQAQHERHVGLGQGLEGRHGDLQQRHDILDNELTETRGEREFEQNRANTLQGERDFYQHRANVLQDGGNKLQVNFNTLQARYNTLEASYGTLQQELDDQEKNCNAEKQRIAEQARQVLDHEQKNSKALREQKETLQDQKRKLEDQIEVLQSDNRGLANEDAIEQLTAALNDQADNEQRGNANQPPQPTPFSNLPTFPPPGTGTTSADTTPSNILNRKKLVPRTSRSPIKNPTGEPEDPAQALLDSLN